MNVYEREIPIESLDIYMTSPPCQAFSIAGKRLGKEDARGILFFNSHEFIKKNKPRFFIFENVKGLLLDDNGNTFNEWVNFLGGKSVNGFPVLFPYADSVPYHLYWKLLNAKHHGVPQNRERVFLIGIRDDVDNKFQFPQEEHLTKRLKDVLEDDVDDKYFLSEKIIAGFMAHNKRHKEKGTGFIFKPKNCESIANTIASQYAKMLADSTFIQVNDNEIANCLRANAGLNATDNSIKVGDYRKDEGFRWREDDNCPCLHTNLKDVDFNKKRGQSAIFISQNHHTCCDQYTTTEYNIRRLTPRECFRLMDFPDTFTWPVSDSQAYNQAGNSIFVRVLEKIIKNLLI
jgi:DNA (cytosine-5)-methyltransferase 1